MTHRTRKNEKKISRHKILQGGFYGHKMDDACTELDETNESRICFGKLNVIAKIRESCERLGNA